MWIEPITDRTPADVIHAEQQIQVWKNAENVIMTDLRGCLNASDLNRIENNTNELADLLRGVGYEIVITGGSNNWNNRSLPVAADFQEIIGNVENLYNRLISDGKLPQVIKTVDNLNAIELAQQAVYDYVPIVTESSDLYSDMIFAGQEIYL